MTYSISYPLVPSSIPIFECNSTTVPVLTKRIGLLLLELIVLVFEPKSLNDLENIEAILLSTSKNQSLKAYVGEQSDIPSPFDPNLRGAARAGSGLDIDDPEFTKHWRMYCGLHFGLFGPCDLEEHCDCEDHICVREQSTVGNAIVAATTLKMCVILLIVMIPPTPTPSESDIDPKHWLLSLVHYNVRIRTTQLGSSGVS
jgi:hypothetical protein